MLLNEHKSKTLFEKAHIPVPQGVALFPGDENDFTPPFPPPWFLKSQVLTGGRGKAGGILRVDSQDQFAQTAKRLFALNIKGHSVPFVRVEPQADIQREFYLSLTISRERRCILLTVGREGGVEIENLGKDNLLVQEIRLPAGIAAHQIRAAFFHLRLAKECWKGFYGLLTNLFRAMTDFGLLMAEINPLILNGDNEFIALDGKVEVDDNFADLDPEMEAYYQREHATAEENMARDAGLSFVRLPGWVGLMVNGAGLAMATMDILNLSGLQASNFLDLGGGADQKRMGIALDLLFHDPQVEAIFINLFGGILSCEKVALAMQGALGGKSPEKPIVVRMAGKDSASALEILHSLDVDNLHIVPDMRGAMDFLRSLKPDEVKFTEETAPEPVPVPAVHGRLRNRRGLSHQQRHPHPGPGHHRQGRPAAHPPHARIRGQHRCGRHAVQGRPGGPGRPGLQLHCRGEGEPRDRGEHHLRAAPHVGGRHPGGRGQRRSLDHMHHRGHRAARNALRGRTAQAVPHAAHRPEHARHHRARTDENRHPAHHAVHARTGRGPVPQRHP